MPKFYSRQNPKLGTKMKTKQKILAGKRLTNLSGLCLLPPKQLAIHGPLPATRLEVCRDFGQQELLGKKAGRRIPQ